MLKWMYADLLDFSFSSDSIDDAAGAHYNLDWKEN